MKTRIVLVEPREAGNVGAVARAMKNFGLRDLAIVGRHPQLLPEAGWWASGSEDLLERARFHATLQEALADAHITVATTSLRGRATPADMTPVELAQLAATMGDDQTLALVFGREDHGLTREEVLLCHHTAAIPTNPAFPTMNLAQAACLFAYELSGLTASTAPRPLPNAALIERLHERAQALLLQSGFLWESNPDHIYDDLRLLLGRAAPDEREAAILLGILRQLEWALKK
jgi:TrmH family RNA methyltransferase